ncbi:hypothetical protein LNO89_23245 [Klebsiella pneumoniae subsp. pneumoniae]|nr:hypothetical protein [Klebsiella pneumoniae subsp. pneumoniae]
MACFFMPLTTITLSGLPPERLAAASSLSNFTRTLAGSIGTSITTTPVDQPRGAASCAAHRIGDPL